MNELNEVEGSFEGRKGKRKLTAEEKWQIYQETNARNAPVGEILRKHGLYPSDLTKIRKQVEEGALKELGRNRYKKKSEMVAMTEYEKLQEELSSKEKALAQMSEEYLLLKKKTS